MQVGVRTAGATLALLFLLSGCSTTFGTLSAISGGAEAVSTIVKGAPPESEAEPASAP